MITISEDLYQKMPDNIRVCFEQLPNPSSEEVRACFPEAGGGKFTKTKRKRFDGWREMEGREDRPAQTEKIDNYGDSGNASRFFKSIIYQPKAGKAERGEGNSHPTVKSVKLMEYLINMATKEGQAVLDLFLGSGTTAVACERLNRRWIGIEISEKYCEIAAKRIENERKQRKLF